MPEYDVLDVAHFIIKKSIDDDNPVTNLKLQKMLYYAWVEYFKTNKEYLFRNEISAWKYGPVVPEVYREFRIFAGVPITRCTDPKDVEFDEKTSDFLTAFVDRNKSFTASELVNLTNRKDFPWDRVYHEDRKYTVIPFKRIIDIECYQCC